MLVTMSATSRLHQHPWVVQQHSLCSDSAPVSKDYASVLNVDLAKACLLAILQVLITDDDIILQGESLYDTLSRYFVAPEMRVMPQSFWDDGHWNGFKIKLTVTASEVHHKLAQSTMELQHCIVNKASGTSCSSLSSFIHQHWCICHTFVSPSSKLLCAMHL